MRLAILLFSRGKGALPDHGTDSRPTKADMALILAAPELLEALESIMSAYEYAAGAPISLDNKWGDKARAAIKRAKGE